MFFLFFYCLCLFLFFFFFFFFNDTATTEIYTLSLHDALPIRRPRCGCTPTCCASRRPARSEEHTSELSHVKISYAVFCLKKKKKKYILIQIQTKKQTHDKHIQIQTKT